jgi:hypothetical protein
VWYVVANYGQLGMYAVKNGIVKLEVVKVGR